jgi:hypothetical protein
MHDKGMYSDPVQRSKRKKEFHLLSRGTGGPAEE